MIRSRVQSFACLIAMLAITLQVILPGSMAMAASDGGDVSRYMCNTPGYEPDQASLKLATELAKKLGDYEKPAPTGDHCPLCTLCHGVPLTAPLIIPEPQPADQPTSFRRYEPALVYETRGPPVGATGPPSLI